MLSKHQHGEPYKRRMARRRKTTAELQETDPELCWSLYLRSNANGQIKEDKETVEEDLQTNHWIDYDD